MELDPPPTGPLWAPQSPRAIEARNVTAPPTSCEAPELLELEESYPEWDLSAGDLVWVCQGELAVGIVYPPSLTPAILADLFWPDDWSIVPPG